MEIERIYKAVQSITRSKRSIVTSAVMKQLYIISHRPKARHYADPEIRSRVSSVVRLVGVPYPSYARFTQGLPMMLSLAEIAEMVSSMI